MKLKTSKTIYIAILLALGLSLFSVNHANAHDGFAVEFEHAPLFEFDKDHTIMPGDSYTRYINLTNNTGEDLSVNTKAIKGSEIGQLSDILNIVIIKDNNIIYSSTTLTAFFNAGNVPLEPLVAGETAIYYYTISFDAQAGNEYQGNILYFNIDIHAESLAGGRTNSYSSASYGKNSGIILSSSAENNSSAAASSKTAAPILTVLKTASKDKVNSGEKGIEYTIKIENSGNAAANGVSLNDALPAGLIYSENDLDLESLNIGDINPGQAYSLTYKVDIAKDAKEGKYVNIVTVTASNHNPVTAEAKINVVSIKVLGAEFAATGFSIKEFLILIFVLILLIWIVFKIKRKYLKK
jgi:uncharacterized repeat protein (TIGR01451 family)